MSARLHPCGVKPFEVAILNLVWIIYVGLMIAAITYVRARTIEIDVDLMVLKAEARSMTMKVWGLPFKSRGFLEKRSLLSGGGKEGLESYTHHEWISYRSF